jgi:hypothetical protein
MIFLDASWAKEKDGERISRRIEMEQGLLDIANFFFQYPNDDIQLVILNPSIFTHL